MYRKLSLAEVRAALRAAACQTAASIPGEPRIKQPTAEACYTGAGAVIVEFRPGDELPAKVSISPVVAAEARRQTRLEAEILRVVNSAGGVPLKGLVIAHRAGREYDSYLRATLADMVRRGVLRRSVTGRGYVVS